MELLLNRSGKASGHLTEVSRGSGFHTPTKFKKKSKQTIKNGLKVGRVLYDENY